MIFVNSMSDIFHKDVPEDYIVSVARTISEAKWHTFQVLTKRSERLRDLLRTRLSFAAAEPHIWWGVSVENRKHGVPRIAHLQAVPAVVRFLSIEPLLEDLGQLDLSSIDWVIVGGESGPGARPMAGMGSQPPRSVPPPGDPVLLQAVGRAEKGPRRPTARQLRRDATSEASAGHSSRRGSGPLVKHGRLQLNPALAG